MMRGSVALPTLRLRCRERDAPQRSQPYRRRRPSVLLENEDAAIYGARVDTPAPRATATSSARPSSARGSMVRHPKGGLT